MNQVPEIKILNLVQDITRKIYKAKPLHPESFSNSNIPPKIVVNTFLEEVGEVQRLLPDGCSGIACVGYEFPTFPLMVADRDDQLTTLEQLANYVFGSKIYQKLLSDTGEDFQIPPLSVPSDFIMGNIESGLLVPCIKGQASAFTTFTPNGHRTNPVIITNPNNLQIKENFGY